MTLLPTRAVLALPADESTEALMTLVHWVILIAILLFVVAPAVWLTGTVLATRSLKKSPSLVADTEDAFYRWVLLVGMLPVVGPIIYAVSYRDARRRATPEQLAAARLTHRERQRRADLAGIG